jgi:nicotinamidase-related amidase
MITKFDKNSCLLLIDVQVGVDVLSHWGGPTGRRNNHDAEVKMLYLLAAWRKANLQVAFTRHDSREASSPLKFSLPTGAQKPGFEPNTRDIVVEKDVNSGFIGTSLEVQLRRAGNLGFDTYLVDDCCSTSNRVGPDGTDRDPELVHAMTVANLHGEFCTAITCDDAISLITADNSTISRCQGNE